MRKLTLWIVFLFSIFVIASCSSPAEPTATEPPVGETVTEEIPPPTIAPPEETQAPTVAPPEEGYPAPTNVPATDTGYPAPTVAPPTDTGYPAPTDIPTPIPLTFPSLDGTQLAGTFYPPLRDQSPVVILMHQFGSDQHQWDTIALWLQTGQPPAGIEWLPRLDTGITFAVFTFDFRGHGASAGNASLDAGLLMDAQSAVAFAKTQPGADPNRVLTIGTSIGADGAVDACLALNETQIAEAQVSLGCLGAMAISPGSFIGVNYTDAATALLSDPHQAVVYCVAAEGDGPSPEACNSVTGTRYIATIYPGSAHGIALFSPDLGFNIGELIHQFLLDSIQLRQ
ncbi:MAG: hypothetical protein H6636_11765 [Anaerolineales bacterium]|nr:hypothetical protein [Anaerolineales bacterium]